MSDTLPICAAGTYDARSAEFDACFVLDGFSDREPHGRWTRQRTARLGFRVAEPSPILMKLELNPFVQREVLPRQRVIISANSVIVAELELDRSWPPRKHAVFLPADRIISDGTVQVQLDLPDATSPASLGINQDQREIGISLRSLEWHTVSERPAANDLIWQLGRPVGQEAIKTFDQKIESGFWQRFVKGPNVLDIGFRGTTTGACAVPILPTAIGVDLDYPGYDGRRLPFLDGSQDAVFSSHCLEHIANYVAIIQDWYRVTRVGGHIITAVPHAHLYERRRRPPSRWNPAHERVYTAASLLAEFEGALKPNSYRVRHLEENDLGYRYELDPSLHPVGCYEILSVIEKIQMPDWTIED